MAQARRRTAAEHTAAYGGAYRRARRAMLAAYPYCAIGIPGVCTTRATTADHVPPLAEHHHVPGSGCCGLRPACAACNMATGGWRLANARRRRGASVQPKPMPRPSRDW